MADVVLITSSTVNLVSVIPKQMQMRRDPAALHMVGVEIRMLIASVMVVRIIEMVNIECIKWLYSE